MSMSSFDLVKNKTPRFNKQGAFKIQNNVEWCYLSGATSSLVWHALQTP